MAQEVVVRSPAPLDDRPLTALIGAGGTDRAARLADLVQPAVLLPADALVADVDAVFRLDDSVACVVLEAAEGPVLVERLWFEATMTGRLGYGRLLHRRRPVAELAPGTTLQLDSRTPVSAAAQAVLDRRTPGTTFDAVVVTAPGRAPGIAGVGSIFESLAQHYAHQSLHDPLTGLPNRLYLVERLRQRGAAEAAPHVLVYVDLDRFKDVNDQHGHAAGDQVLVQFAQRLRSVSRGGDVVVRLGGDEFAVLMDGRLTRPQCTALAERLVMEAAAPFAVTVEHATTPHEVLVRLGASVGVARADDQASPIETTSLDVLLKQADLAMFRAKAGGRGRVAHYDSDLRPDDHETSTRRAALDMERRLRGAIEGGELEVHYQPVVELPSGRVTSVEALARWTDAELGSVPPDTFIVLAERTGLIHDLGRWVLDTACHEAASWTHEDGTGPVSVSVNVSPVQLAERSVVPDVVGALRRSGLPPERLCLEVTETAAVRDLEQTAARLAELRAIGVTIALDDFGTGHTSLTMLRTLPVQVVKVDRSFVRHVTTRATDAVLVSLVVDTAHSLGLRVCAEGVEDAEQAAHLAAMGCDAGQGWFFGRPLPAGPRLRELVSTRRTHATDDRTAPAPALQGDRELVLVTTPRGVVTYASHSAQQVLGRTPAELVGARVLDLVHPDDVRDDPTAGGTQRVRHADGSWRWLRATARRLGHVSSDHDDHRDVLVVARDVTEEVLARHALQDSEARFRTAFDDAPLPMTVTALDGTFLQVNTAFAELVGRTADELLRLRVRDVTHPADRPRDDANTRQLRSALTSRHDLVKRYVHADGSAVAATVRATLVRGNGTRPDTVIAHVTPG